MHTRWKPLGANLPTEAILHEADSKESKAQAQGQEWSRVLSRLEELEVTPATQELFRRFTVGELTIQELDIAIERSAPAKSQAANSPPGRRRGEADGPVGSERKLWLSQRTLLVWALLLACWSLIFLFPRWQRSGWPQAHGTVIEQQFPSRRTVVLLVEYSSPSGQRIGRSTLNWFEASFAQGGGYSEGRPVQIRFNPDNYGETEIVGWGVWQDTLMSAILLVSLLWRAAGASRRETS